VTTGSASTRDERTGKSANAFRTISEVADDLDVAQHVLRFWESKFPQIRPLKRGGGRRYYRPEDVDVLKEIRELLYRDGYTIKGAQKLLRQRRSPSLRSPSAQSDEPMHAAAEAQLPSASGAETAEAMAPLEIEAAQLRALRDELDGLRRWLRQSLSDPG